MIHLVFGASAAGSLKHAFRKQACHRVIAFPVDFSVGPITNIHENSGIDHYFSWLQDTFHDDTKYFPEAEAVYRESLQSLQAIEAGEQVTIWTSASVSEQIGLSICCRVLKDKEVELYAVNTFHAMHAYWAGTDYRQDVLHSGECNAEQLLHFYHHAIRPLTAQLIDDYARVGERLLKCAGTRRTWQHGEITAVPETIDDAFILACAKRVHQEEAGQPDFILAARVIGEVIGHTEQALSDSWIDYRLRALISSGRLAYEGNLISMLKYKVRVVQ